MVFSVSTPRPRLALIGVSGYGRIYFELVREALAKGEVELVAAVIIDAERVRDIVVQLQSYGTVIYDDAATFFNEQQGRIDLCLIPVGIPWHARLTVSALRAGMNVLVEKPLAGCVADAEAIRKAEAETGRWVAVGFQDLYADEAHWLKHQLLGGEIGQIREIRMIGLWRRPPGYFTRNDWAGRVASDGVAVLDSPVNNAFAHFINLSLFLAGSAPLESQAIDLHSVELYRAHQIEMFDTAIIRGASASGVRFWFGVSHCAEVDREPEVIILGSEGRAEWLYERQCTLTNSGGIRQIPMPSIEQRRKSMFAAVLQRLHSPQAFVCTTDIAREHIRLVEAAQHFSPIQDFPETEICIQTNDQSQVEALYVKNLDQQMARAFDAGAPLSKRLQGVTESASITP